MTKEKTYALPPVNSVKGLSKYFDWAYEWITEEHCSIVVREEIQEIELVRLGRYVSTEDAIRELAERGYVPAPVNYLLSLGITHPEVHADRKWIVSLDKSNIFADEHGSPCFLCLYWNGKRRLSMAGEADDWNDGWWFAVVRKSNLKPSESVPLTLESLAFRIEKLENK